MNAKTVPIKTRIINNDATKNAKIQSYKKATIEKAKKEIAKIEAEINQLEQDKI